MSMSGLSDDSTVAQKEIIAMGKIPEFASDKEAAEFWDTHDLTNLEDELELAKDVVFVKPETQTISIRMDRQLVERLKAIATYKGMGYSPLIRMWITERLRQETKKQSP